MTPSFFCLPVSGSPSKSGKSRFLKISHIPYSFGSVSSGCSTKNISNAVRFRRTKNRSVERQKKPTQFQKLPALFEKNKNLTVLFSQPRSHDGLFVGLLASTDLSQEALTNPSGSWSKHLPPPSLSTSSKALLFHAEKVAPASPGDHSADREQALLFPGSPRNGVFDADELRSRRAVGDNINFDTQASTRRPWSSFPPAQPGENWTPQSSPASMDETQNIRSNKSSRNDPSELEGKQLRCFFFGTPPSSTLGVRSSSESMTSRNLLRFFFAFLVGEPSLNLGDLSQKSSAFQKSQTFFASFPLKRGKGKPKVQAKMSSVSKQTGLFASSFFSGSEIVALWGIFIRSFVTDRLIDLQPILRKTLESFPILRYKQYKIPVIPIILCIIPYIVFLGLRQTFFFVHGQQSISTQFFEDRKNIGTNYTQVPRLESDIRLSLANPVSPGFDPPEKALDLVGKKLSLVLVAGPQNLGANALALNIPSLLSKLFVVWAIQQIASIRPQRKMTQKAEQSQQTRILFPNEISVCLENLQGLTAVLPLLHILTESLHFSRRRGSKTSFDTQTPPNSFQFPLLSQFFAANQQTPGTSRREASGASSKRFVDSGFTLAEPRGIERSDAPKGYLFVGPPGTGKTRLAQALAKEANVPLLCVSASEIQKQIEIGTRIGALRLRKIFETAREYAPCILFFDEIDAIGKTRGGENVGASDNQLLTEFLIQMDSVSIREGFVVIGTTNYLSHLDSAFIRSGRFDRILSMNLPSKNIRVKILQSCCGSINRGEQNPSPPFGHRSEKLFPDSRSEPGFASIKLGGVPWNYFGYFTQGFSQAHLARLVNESFLFSCKNKIAQRQGLGLSASFLQTGKTKGEHTFESLQHGFNRIKAHRKNFHTDTTV